MVYYGIVDGLLSIAISVLLGLIGPLKQNFRFRVSLSLVVVLVRLWSLTFLVTLASFKRVIRLMSFCSTCVTDLGRAVKVASAWLTPIVAVSKRGSTDSLIGRCLKVLRAIFSFVACSRLKRASVRGLVSVGMPILRVSCLGGNFVVCSVLSIELVQVGRVSLIYDMPTDIIRLGN